MGARNVSAVFALWPDLKPGPKVALLWMALKSLDARSAEGRPPRVYYDGEQSLTEALGQSRRSVYSALEALREAGAIEVLEHGRMKHRAVYKLRLDATSRVQPAAPTRVQPSAPNRVQPAAQQGAARCTPRNHEGGTEESREGENPGSSTTSLEPVDNSANPEESYRAASRALTNAWGTERAGTAVAEHMACHDCGPREATIAVAATLRPTLSVLKGGKTA